MTSWSFTGLLVSKLLSNVRSQISVVEMFTYSELGQESCLIVLDKHEKAACWASGMVYNALT